MNVGTHPLPTLGQGQQLSGSSDPVLRLPQASSELSALAREADVKARSWSSARDALSKFREYHEPEPMCRWVAELWRHTGQSGGSFLEKPEGFLSDLNQFGTPRSEPLITSAERSEKASPYRGRVTGPVKFVNQLLATWQLPPESACALLGFEPTRFTDVNEVLQGYGTLTGRDVKDRIVHLIQIRTSLVALFRDETVENEWLREPRDVLKGQAPIDLLLEGSMENLLLVKEYVEFVART